MLSTAVRISSIGRARAFFLCEIWAFPATASAGGINGKVGRPMINYVLNLINGDETEILNPHPVHVDIA